MAPGPGGALDMSPEASLSSHPGHDLSVDHIQGKELVETSRETDWNEPNLRGGKNKCLIWVQSVYEREYLGILDEEPSIKSVFTF